MTWVKFHEELMQGAKRGLKREHRFVYMELSLLTRPGRGRIALPIGMSDADAVCDLLGGDAKQVRAAIVALTTGKDPMVAFEGEEGDRHLVVVSWGLWNAAETPGASTERSRRHRVAQAAQRTATIVALRPQRPSNDDATGCNDPPSVEESREDQIRSDPPKVPLAGDGSGNAPKAVSKKPPTGPAAELAAHYETAFEAVRGEPPPKLATADYVCVAKVLSATGGDLDKAKRIVDAGMRADWPKNPTIRTISADPAKWVGNPASGFQRKHVQPMGPSQSKRIDEDPDDTGWLAFPEAAQ